MTTPDTTRRDFIAKSGSAAGGMWLMRFAPLIAATQACATEARDAGEAFRVFSPREALDFEAFAARIIPTDDTPGATEAGSVYFADRALETFLADILPIVRGGMEGLSARAVEAHPDAAGFAELAEPDQDTLISATEEADPGFFFFARTLVMLSLVGDPSYGGNRDGVGWALLGFEPRFAYAPPFGHYDRNEHGAASAAARPPSRGDAASRGETHADTAPVATEERA